MFQVGDALHIDRLTGSYRLFAIEAVPDADLD
jgi:hypothetical protein